MFSWVVDRLKSQGAGNVLLVCFGLHMPLDKIQYHPIIGYSHCLSMGGVTRANARFLGKKNRKFAISLYKRVNYKGAKGM
jgi:hypothetical protein